MPLHNPKQFTSLEKGRVDGATIIPYEGHPQAWAERPALHQRHTMGTGELLQKAAAASTAADTDTQISSLSHSESLDKPQASTQGLRGKMGLEPQGNTVPRPPQGQSLPTTVPISCNPDKVMSRRKPAHSAGCHPE